MDDPCGARFARYYCVFMKVKRRRMANRTVALELPLFGVK